MNEKLLDEQRQADFATFDAGLIPASSWISRLSRLPLLTIWLICSMYLGYHLITSGNNLTVFNLIGGVASIVVTGVVAGLVDLYGTRTRQTEAQTEPGHERGSQKAA